MCRLYTAIMMKLAIALKNIGSSGSIKESSEPRYPLHLH